MINSHIIPAFYLEQFASPSPSGKNKPGRIWVYEKGREPDERATSVQGKEKGYFGFFRPDGTMEESFERVLADHENACNDILVCAKSDLFYWPRGSHEKLAFYAALLYLRATQARTFAYSNWNKILKEIEQSIADDELVTEIAGCLGRRLGTQVPPDMMRNYVLDWIEKAKTPATAANSFLSDILQMSEYIAGWLLKKQPWRILRPPNNTEFITTDNPLVTFVPLKNGVLHPGYGFGKPFAVSIFPLGPQASLLMGNAWEVPTTLTPAELVSLHEMLISMADRYIYSKSRSDSIDELVQEYAGSCRYGVNALMPVGLNMPSARDFLRMKFCGGFDT